MTRSQAGKFGNQTGLSSGGCSGDCSPGTYSSFRATTCLQCDGGRYAPQPGTENCLPCPDLGASQPGATECGCQGGFFMRPDGNCSICGDGSSCEQGSTLEGLVINKEHWRSSNLSQEVLACPVPAACAGSEDAAATAEGCVDGNTGVLCAVCAPGFARSTRSKPCIECGTAGEAWGSAILSGLVVLAMLAIMLFVNRKAPNATLRPMINFAQTLSIMLLFDAPWPELVVSIGAWASSLSLELGFISLSPPGCTGVGRSFYLSYGLWLLLLSLVTLCLFLPAVLDARRARLADPSLQARHAFFNAKRLPECLRDVLILLLLVHPALSGRTLELFRCQAIDMPAPRGRVSFLMADFSLECYTGAWWAQAVLHILVLVFFTAGAIVTIACMLWKRRATLQEPGTQKYFGLLTMTYKPERYYYEPINMSFKVL